MELAQLIIKEAAEQLEKDWSENAVLVEVVVSSVQGRLGGRLSADHTLTLEVLPAPDPAHLLIRIKTLTLKVPRAPAKPGSLNTVAVQLSNMIQASGAVKARHDTEVQGTLTVSRKGVQVFREYLATYGDVERSLDRHLCLLSFLV